MFESLAYSAQLYYEFLEQHQRSLEKIIIIRKEKISDEELKLILATRYIHTESLVLRMKDEFFLLDGENIRIEFNENKGEMILGADVKLVALMLKENIELYSDLKFLVHNVQRFYERNADQMVSLFSPEYLSDIQKQMSQESFEPVAHLDSYQNKALELLLSTPISYIWGPPGSGKTKGVLLEALLIKMRQQSKVLLLAPTNTALDQILFSILPRIQQNGYALEQVLRLGIPSQSFLQQYTSICDPNILAKKGTQDLFTLTYQKSYKERLKEACVIAMTVDGFIKRYDLLSQIEHVFLDEAPYTSLIKALCLSYLKAPLTFLGDHKQLGPVCEANEKDFKQERKIMRAWSLSALYIEEYCKKGEALLDQSPVLPEFQHLKQAKLLQNYRYGKNLTTILDNFVYNIGLQGLLEDTEIFYVDAGSHFVEAGQYESLKEAQVLAQITLAFSKEEAVASRNDLFAVITPFNLQRKLIARTASHLRDKVFTIHKSQGLEFDRVLFSPVLLHYYLTDSRNPNALQALNVAISRARKQMIIVCDFHFWKKQKNQFISVLLENANPYPLE